MSYQLVKSDENIIIYCVLGRRKQTLESGMFSRRILIVSIFAMLVSFMNPLGARAEDVLKQGSFTGKSGHKTSGTVKIVKTAAGVEVHLGGNFKLDGAPGPYLGFGKSGQYDKSSQFSKLNANTGAQVYKLPGKINTTKYNEIYVWCGPFNVPLGVAKLN
jgi:hypothetical protein